MKAPKVDMSAPTPPPVPPLQSQVDKRPAKKPMAPTFLGTDATPSLASAASGGGGKTLLGQ